MLSEISGSHSRPVVVEAAGFDPYQHSMQDLIDVAVGPPKKSNSESEESAESRHHQLHGGD